MFSGDEYTNSLFLQGNVALIHIKVKVINSSLMSYFTYKVTSD